MEIDIGEFNFGALESTSLQINTDVDEFMDMIDAPTDRPLPIGTEPAWANEISYAEEAVVSHDSGELF